MPWLLPPCGSVCDILTYFQEACRHVFSTLRAAEAFALAEKAQ